MKKEDICVMINGDEKETGERQVLKEKGSIDERDRMFGECHAHIFMDGVNYRHAVERHLNGVDDRVSL